MFAAEVDKWIYFDFIAKNRCVCFVLHPSMSPQSLPFECQRLGHPHPQPTHTHTHTMQCLCSTCCCFSTFYFVFFRFDAVKDFATDSSNCSKVFAFTLKGFAGQGGLVDGFFVFGKPKLHLKLNGPAQLKRAAQDNLWHKITRQLNARQRRKAQGAHKGQLRLASCNSQLVVGYSIPSCCLLLLLRLEVSARHSNGNYVKKIRILLNFCARFDYLQDLHNLHFGTICTNFRHFTVTHSFAAVPFSLLFI